MHRIVQRFAVSALVIVVAAQAFAAERATTTVMTVSEMCGGCVQKITGKLETIPGVATISCDVKSKSVTVTHAAGTSLSARTLWVAMEEIGKTPKKLAGPEGTFTSKPKS